MKYSKLFGKTVKTESKDAFNTSHRYLLKGGFIRPLGAGRYTFLPLGMKVRNKVVNVIREEIEKTGAQEIIIPTLHPIDLWKRTHREEKFGESLMRVKDRRGAEFALGATGEAVMMDLVNQFSPSYRDLPINIYQFSQKFRDETRAKGGLLRVREFLMKDGYSFHISEEEFMNTYKAYWDAYLKIADKFDLDVEVVESDSGALGGEQSHEFMVISDVGEDILMKCDKCGYTANIEKAEFVRNIVNLDEDMKDFEMIEQPEWVETMDDNVKHYKLPKERFLKNVVYKDSKGRIIIGVIRGDLQISETKLAKVAHVSGTMEPATDEDLISIGTKRGWVHCWGHDAVYVGDLSLKTVRNFIGGQKGERTDSINVNYGRDFECDYFGDIAEAVNDSLCTKCNGGKLKSAKCIEFGNIFNLGTTYSDSLDGDFMDKDGKPKKIWMGSYGMGIGRAMATIIETHNDDKGMIWPKSVAPFDVHIISLSQDDAVIEKTEELYNQLTSDGVEVLWDDRKDSSAGEKFADADLIGIPLQIIIGTRSLEKESFECKVRKDHCKVEMGYEEVLEFVR